MSFSTQRVSSLKKMRVTSPFYVALFIASFFIVHMAFTMEQDGHQYHLSVKKFQNDPDDLDNSDNMFRVKISKKPLSTDVHPSAGTPESQSLIADFNTTCKNEFAWSNPDFGQIKLQRDGSVFVGHGADNVPLAHSKVTINTSGELFLGALRARALTIKSPNTQITAALVADQLHADHEVLNNGCLKTKQLLGKGNFFNAGLLELEGTEEHPALLGIKKFHNSKSQDSTAQPTVRASYVQVTGDNQSFENKEDATLDVSNSLIVEPSNGASFGNEGSLTTHALDLRRNTINEGCLQAHTLKVQNQRLNNKKFGNITVSKEFSAENAEVNNEGDFNAQGDVNLTSAKVHNAGTMNYKQGALSCTAAQLHNANNLLMEGMTSSTPFDITNDKELQLKGSSLLFRQLHNKQDLILHSGIYTVKDFINNRLQLLNHKWAISSHFNYYLPSDAHKLLILKPSYFLGKIECPHDVSYDLKAMPTKLSSQADIACYTDLNDIRQLSAFTTPGRVSAWLSPSVTMLDTPQEFPHIGNLYLHTHGPLTTHSSFKTPALNLDVKGPLVVGKDNDTLGTIAATSGTLTIKAHNIDGRYGKFYGKGRTDLTSTQGDILVGAPKPGGQFAYTFNGAYVVSNNALTVKAAKELKIAYGRMISQGKQTLEAAKITKIADDIASSGDIEMIAKEFENTRDATRRVNTGDWTYAYTDCYDICESSDQAFVRALGNITFKVDKGTNLASSILAGGKILYSPFTNAPTHSPTPEQPASFTSTGRTNWGYGYHDRQHYHHQSGTPRSQYPSTLLSGQDIQIATDNVVITSAMNSPFISIQAKTGLFGSNNRSRQTLNPTAPVVVNLTEYIQNQARQAGFYRLGANNKVETEFPLGTASAPQQGDAVLLANSKQATPLRWQDIFNPLRSIDLNPHLQQLMAHLAGKVYAGKARGNNLAPVLWQNANAWRQEHGEVMSPSDVENLNSSMLLTQIAHDGTTEHQQTLLCVAPGDINPYQSEGDIVTDSFKCTTEGNQTYLSSRVVAQGKEGITIESTKGDVTLATQVYTDSYENHEGRVTEQRAGPQQELLAPNGPINITAHGTLRRTGDLVAAADKVNEHAAKVVKSPLVLQRYVEKIRKKRGLFSTKTTVQTSLTHQVLPPTTISGTTIHDKGTTSITAIAPQDRAGEELIYESPNTTIEGLIVADRTTKQSEISSAFSHASTSEQKETPCAVPANLQAPIIRLVGGQARINANINAQELRDETEQGAKFVAKVAEMICSGQTQASTPFSNLDAGYNAGSETMLPPLLMVGKIIREKDTGNMLFESAIIDKNRTEIIGKFVETTYQLKQWQTSWCHKSQLIPDEALVVVALAVTLATQGMGVQVFSSIIADVTAATGMQLSAAGVAMVNAGFSAVCSGAANSFAKTGDPLQPVEQLASPESLKSIACAMASAGLCSELGQALNINMEPGFNKSLVDHVQEQALRSSVDGLLNIAIHGATADATLGDALKQIPLKTVAAYVANQICTASMNTIERKMAHTLVGGASGFALEASSNGVISGALGALAAETVGDVLIADAQEIAIIAAERVAASGKPMTMENMHKAIREEVHRKAQWAKVAAAAVAAAAQQNPSIASATASNVVDNDTTIRGSLYATQEFQKMLLAASQAYTTLSIHGAEQLRAFQRGEQLALEEELIEVLDAEVIDEKALDDFQSYYDKVFTKALQNEDLKTAEKAREKLKMIGAYKKHKDTITSREQSDARLAAEVDQELTKALNAKVLNEEVLESFHEHYAQMHEFARESGDKKGLQRTSQKLKLIMQTMQKQAEKKEKQASPAKPFVDYSIGGRWESACMSGDLVFLIPGSEREKEYQKVRGTWRKHPACPFVVAAEGYPEGIVSTKMDGSSIVLNEKDVAQMIKENPRYRKGHHVHIFSNNTGIGENSFAQKLADELQVPVSAPTGLIQIATHRPPYSFRIVKPIGDPYKPDQDHARLRGPDYVDVKLGEIKTFQPRTSAMKPFVNNPTTGEWSKACISETITLLKEGGDTEKDYQTLKRTWRKDKECPVVVAAHGAEHDTIKVERKIHAGVLYDDKAILNNHGMPVFLNASELAQLIRTSPVYTEGHHILLWSCDAGVKPDGIAQQLADILKVPVHAPNGYIYQMPKKHAFRIIAPIYPNDPESNHIMTIMSAVHGNPELGEFRTFHPRELQEPILEPMVAPDAQDSSHELHRAVMQKAKKDADLPFYLEDLFKES